VNKIKKLGLESRMIGGDRESSSGTENHGRRESKTPRQQRVALRTKNGYKESRLLIENQRLLYRINGGDRESRKEA
jgi:hypothetical protein